MVNKSNKKSKHNNKKQYGGSRKDGFQTSNFQNYLSKLTDELESLSNNQSGGGYTVNVNDYIAGMPSYNSYIDCSPPVLLNNKMESSKSCQPMCGGSKKKSKKLSKRNNKRRNNKTQKRRKNKSKKMSRRKKKNNRKNMRGGSYGNYPIKGEKSVFTADMNLRNFNCNQPKWSPDCI